MVDSCKICGTRTDKHFQQANYRDHEIRFYECSKCFFVQTNEPVWLTEAYSEPINLSDTGILERNLTARTEVFALLRALNSAGGTVLDYAGGYGILVRLLRDIGVNALWYDLYCDNLLARGFEYASGPISLLAAYEAFEHFLHPIDEIKKMLSISDCILLSTEIMPSPSPDPSDWWYYGLEHGQHISFYREKTFLQIAADLNLTYVRLTNNLHFLSRKKLPFAFRLRWLIEKRLSLITMRFRDSLVWTDHLSMKNHR
jgi:hypothetical protein